VGVRDGMWARVVDVGRALASRTYATPVDVVVEVRDDFCPWNAGRWHLTGDAGGATCARVGSAADLVLDARDLAAHHLGRPSLRALGVAGLVEERTRGALGVVSQAFRHDPVPWSDTAF
jgi:predicted acetyltransferase